MRTRSAFNTIVPDRLYQRGQIYTWTLDVKKQALQELGITAVLNLWPKTDPDMSNLNLDAYLQLYCPHSKDTLNPSVIKAADSMADYLRLPGRRLLVLCEAGKTRSVFFSILVVRNLLEISTAEAKELVLSKVPSSSLKGFMHEWLERN
jgi:hypothetical protein